MSSHELEAAATVRLSDDLLWINECYPVTESLHEHVSVYLIDGRDGRIVIDSGSFYHRDSIRARLHESTDGRGLDALILSHSDYPHSGNIRAFREEWGDIEIVASSGAPEIQGLPYARKCTIGDSMAVCGRRFSFIDPPLADRSHTTWIFDHESGALFTSDGFGNFHAPGQCDWTYADFPDGIPVDEICEYHREGLSWLHYVEPEKLSRPLRSIFEEFPVSWVCPVHGNPIAGADADAYLDRLLASVARIADEYEGPSQ